MSGRWRRKASGAALLLAVLFSTLLSSAYGYTHYVRYPSRTGPFTPILQRFDLNALVSRTVLYHITDLGPTQLAANDTFAGVVSQIRAAAAVWNTVETSELRLQFGGLYSQGTPQSAASVEVIFDDLPPGVMGMGGPALLGDLASGPGGPFIPIGRSVVILRRDLTERRSFSEGFFLTAVHEFGHALGLQHTLASSVMSTEITRASTRAYPLGQDDIAGISLLYPARGFPLTMGSIAGRVSSGGEGLAMASVVAIAVGGAAVSTLTHPDGSYRIDGVPPGDYYVYAHPLPPALPSESSPANLVMPADLDGRAFPAPASFDTSFYPGGREPRQTVAVHSGSTAESINFNVARRTGPALYAVQTYSFPGQVAVKPAHLNRAVPGAYIVASGAGLVAANAPARGLDVRVLGSGASLASGGLKPYSPAAASFVQMDFQFTLFSPNGAYHMYFSLNNDVYVLPAAFRAVDRQPPSITSVVSLLDGGPRLAAISGTNLSAETRILVDGLPASVRGFEDGRLTVSLPPGQPGHRAAAVALNPDGQSSLFLQGSNPATYIYEGGEAGTLVSVTPQALAAGSEAMVEITGSNFNFAEGFVNVGFGSGDIIVRRVWVAGPNRILANVAVSPAAPVTATMFTLSNGLQVNSYPFSFQILPSNSRQISVTPPSNGLLAGATATVAVSNLTNTAGLALTVNGVNAQIVGVAGNLVSFLVPAGLPVGPAILRLQAGSETALPIVVAIDAPPPLVLAAYAGLPSLGAGQPGTPVDASRPARPGDFLTLAVARLGDPTPPADRINVQVGGVDHPVINLAAAASPNTHYIVLVLSPNVSAGAQVPVTVTVEGRTSPPVALPIR